MTSEVSKKQVKTSRQKRREKEQVKKITGYILVGVIAVLLGIFFLTRPHAEALTAERLALDPAYGAADAKVVILEYSDFACPSCQAWHNSGILDQLRKTYGDKVRFVWKDFPVITAASPKAAEAAQCAMDQGKFWEYHDLLYEKSPAISNQELKDYANQLGLDASRFNNCLDSGQNAAKVEQSTREGYRYGFNGAPSFVVNGKVLVGPPSFETLKSLIDPILATGG